MPADTSPIEPGADELAALRDMYAETPAAVYVATTGRVYLCPNLMHTPGMCAREFTVPEAMALADRLREAVPWLRPVVLAYGIPYVPVPHATDNTGA